MATISLVIPVFNEEERLGEFFPQLVDFLTKKLPQHTWTIMLVNDGSKDKTASVMRTLQLQHAHHPKMRIQTTSLKRNSGKGRALQKGILMASSDYIFFTDIDLSASLNSLTRMISILEKNKADIAIATRRLPKSQIQQHQPYFRELMGRIFTRMTNIVLGLDYSDMTCGLKGGTQSAMKMIFKKISSHRWLFDAEILITAKQNSLRVVQIPTDWKNDHRTKVKIGKDTLTSLRDLVRIKINDIHGRYAYPRR